METKPRRRRSTKGRKNEMEGGNANIFSRCKGL